MAPSACKHDESVRAYISPIPPWSTPPSLLGFLLNKFISRTVSELFCVVQAGKMMAKAALAIKIPEPVSCFSTFEELIQKRQQAASTNTKEDEIKPL